MIPIVHKNDAQKKRYLKSQIALFQILKAKNF